MTTTKTPAKAPRHAPHTVDAPLPVEEQKRCRVETWRAARHAPRFPAVQRLRTLLFGAPDATVTRERAFDLLESPATHYLTPQQFEDAGLAFADHTAVLAAARTQQQAGATFRDVHVRVRSAGRSAPFTRRVTLDDADGVHTPPSLTVPTRDGRTQPVTTFPGTYLRRIRDGVQNVALDLLWTEADTVLFVLTGEVPEVQPATIRVEVARDEKGQPLRAELVLRLQAHVTYETARKAVARALRRVTYRQGTVRRGRPLSLRSLALYRFVEEQTDRDKGTRPGWGALLDRWNTLQRREWRYGSRMNLRRDYLRTVTSLVRLASALDPLRPR